MRYSDRYSDTILVAGKIYHSSIQSCVETILGVKGAGKTDKRNNKRNRNP